MNEIGVINKSRILAKIQVLKEFTEDIKHANYATQAKAQIEILEELLNKMCFIESDVDLNLMYKSLQDPYLHELELNINRKWNQDFPQNAICKCAHVYYRHFDSFENMEDCGCKYCGCGNFELRSELNKVYQVNINPDNGDCMQAAVATILGLQLDEVPKFIEQDKLWFRSLLDFMLSKGYEWQGQLLYNGIENPLYKINNYEGINGYFLGVVKSPKYHELGKTHMVIVDGDLNIVHDPNPEYKDIEYPIVEGVTNYTGIMVVYLFG